MSSSSGFPLTLHDAAVSGDLEATRALIAAGAEVNARSSYYKDADGRSYWYTALHLAARDGRDEVVNVLLLAGADVNARSSCYNDTPLHLARRYDRTALKVAQDKDPVNVEVINCFHDHINYTDRMGKDSLRGIWVRAAVVSAKTMHSSAQVEVMDSSPSQLPGSNAGAGGPSL